jgi:antitoxin ParD1/3/4
MGRVEKISVAVPSEMAELLSRAVESGDYASVSEVVREALRDWKQHQELRSIEREELRRLWREGLESGPPMPMTPARWEAIKARGRARLEREKAGE